MLSNGVVIYDVRVIYLAQFLNHGHLKEPIKYHENEKLTVLILAILALIGLLRGIMQPFCFYQAKIWTHSAYCMKSVYTTQSLQTTLVLWAIKG